MTESYVPIYSDESTIIELTKFIGQEPSDTLLATVMMNADSTVNSRLSRHSLPIFKAENKNIPNVLKTAANYYAVSDIIQVIYGKDDRSTNEQGFYTKAEALVTNYIEQQLVELEDTELKQQSPYGYSQSQDAYDLGLIHR